MSSPSQSSTADTPDARLNNIVEQAVYADERRHLQGKGRRAIIAVLIAVLVLLMAVYALFVITTMVGRSTDTAWYVEPAQRISRALGSMPFVFEYALFFVVITIALLMQKGFRRQPFDFRLYAREHQYDYRPRVPDTIGIIQFPLSKAPLDGNAFDRMYGTLNGRALAIYRKYSSAWGKTFTIVRFGLNTPYLVFNCDQLPSY